jgi:hypothetical protein
LKPAAKSNRAPWIIGGSVLLAAIILVVVILAGRNNLTTPTALKATTTPSATHASSPTYSPPLDETAPPPVFTYDIPHLSDFHATLRTVSKQCYGDIGCNWDVKIRLSESGDLNLDPDITYDLTYRVTGDESGPIIGTIEVTGTQYSVETEFISTSQNSVVPRIMLIEISD